VKRGNYVEEMCLPCILVLFLCGLVGVLRFELLVRETGVPFGVKLTISLYSLFFLFLNFGVKLTIPLYSLFFLVLNLA
jgi:hypothetical protein